MRAIKKQDLDNITYYQVPKWLMDIFIDKKVSQGAFKTYVLMYDRVRLSRKNNWIDKDGDVFIRYSYSEMQSDLNCSRQSISNNIKDLESVNLIDKKRNFNKSSTYYLNIYDSSLENLTSKENLTNTSLENLTDISLENLDTSNNNFNKNNKNKNNITQSEYDKFCDKISEITGLNLHQIHSIVQPIKIKDLDKLKIMQEIDNSKFLQEQKGMDGFRKYFSTFQQLNKIEQGYYMDTDKEETKFTEYTEEEEYSLDGLLKELGE